MRVSYTIRRILPTIALALVAVVPAFGGSRQMSLDDAINLALEKNEDIFIAQESASSAASALSGAKGAYDPSLEISSGYNRTRQPAGVGTTDAFGTDQAQLSRTFQAQASLSQYLGTGGMLTLKAATSRGSTDNFPYSPLSPVFESNLGVELRQPLLRNLFSDPSRLAIRVARADRIRSAAQLELVMIDIVAAVERAYWNLSAANAEVGVREESVRLAEKQLSQTEDRVQQGSSPETETAQPRAELERRRGELLASREAASRAETALKLLILGDDDTALWQDTLDPIDNSSLAVTPMSREGAMERALEVRPEVALAQAQIEGRQAEKKFANSSAWPALDAVLSYERTGWSGDPNSEAAAYTGPIVSTFDGGWGKSWSQIGDKDFENINVGLVLSYPIGNRAAGSARAIARHTERQAEAQLKQVRKAIRADVLNAFAALETAGQRVEAARAERQAAEIQLAAEEDRFKVGLTTNFLVLTRQNDLSRAQLDEIATKADYRIANTDFARAIGSLLERHKIQIEPLSR